MTEAEWLTCGNPWVMLPVLGYLASDRKLRLFICACCRRWPQSVPHPHLWRFFTLMEQRADGTATGTDLLAAWTQSVKMQRQAEPGINLGDNPFQGDYWEEAVAIALQLEPIHPGNAALAVDFIAQDIAASVAGFDMNQELACQCRLLRELFGNPFHPATVEAAWHTSNAVAVAQGIYETGDFTRLPILADALEDAGCTNADMLNHCRQRGEHVRGCWVVDLLMGKS